MIGYLDVLGVLAKLPGQRTFLSNFPIELEGRVIEAAQSLHHHKMMSRAQEGRASPASQDALLETAAEVAVTYMLKCRGLDVRWLAEQQVNTGAYDLLVEASDYPVKLDVKLSKLGDRAGTTSIMNSEHRAVFEGPDADVLHVRVLLNEETFELTVTHVFAVLEQSWIDSHRDTISKYIYLDSIVIL